MKYSEVFSRVYTKVTQQTDTQHPKIQAFGQANLDDLFLNGMLKTPNTEGSLLPKMTVGFRNMVAERIKMLFLDVFKRKEQIKLARAR